MTKNAGWIRLLGIAAIIQGILFCLTVVGLVVAWLPIWLGLLLTRTGRRLGDYQKGNLEVDVQGAMSTLSFVVKVSAIAVLVSTIVSTFVLIIIGPYGVGTMIMFTTFMVNKLFI